MKVRCLVLGVAALLAALSSPASAQSSEPRSRDARDGRSSRSSFQEQFGEIVERNIFLRDRRSAATSPPPSTAPTTAPVVLPENRYVLVGIVFEEGENRAYLESRSDGRILKLVTGETLARGRVAEIAFDAVAYEFEGGRQWVEIGQDLTGRAAMPGGVATGGGPAPSGGEGSTASAPAAAPPAPGSAAAMSIEERLRQRRLQQGGR
jgi:hypothetical protein